MSNIEIELYNQNTEINTNSTEIELYNKKTEINTTPPEIIIEISGLTQLKKFIGLEDTPTYYENGKFFRVLDSKIVYTDITWEDIKGDIDKNPELQQEVLKLVEENAKKYTEEAVNNAVDAHNKNENAHPYIQNIIEENFENLTNKIELNKIDTNQKIDEANSKIDTNKSNIDRLDTFTEEINTNLENLTLEVNVDIKGDISKLQDDLQTTNQEVSDNFTILDIKIDNTKSELTNTISNNYTTLDTKIDNTKSELTNTISNTKSELSGVISENYTILDTKIDTTKSELKNTISDNYTTLDNKITENYNNLDLRVSTNTQDISDLTQVVEDDFQEVNTHITDLNTRVTNNTNNITALDTKVDNTKSELETSISENYTTLDTKVDNTKSELETSISENYTTLDTKIDNVNNTSIKDVVYDKLTQKFTVTFGDTTTKFLTLEELLTGASYDGDTGNFTFTKANGEPVIVNTPKENFLSDVQYNSETKTITFIMTSGSTFEVNISDLIDVYTVKSTNSVSMNMTSAGEISSDIKISNDEDNIISIETDGLLAKHQDISHLATKSEVQTGLSNKVDKEYGKVLISQTELDRLANVDNYDDTQVKADISTLQTSKQDILTAGEGIKIENNIISTESTKILTDNTTIIQNDDNTITTVGTKTKSNTNLYNWVGTNEQYDIDISNGTITSDTQCLITDDETELVEYIPKATNSSLGLVQPDGTSITIDEQGVISSAGGGSNIIIRKW